MPSNITIFHGILSRYNTTECNKIREYLKQETESTFSVFRWNSSSEYGASWYYADNSVNITTDGKQYYAFYHGKVDRTKDETMKKWLQQEFGWAKPHSATTLKDSIRDKAREEFKNDMWAFVVVPTATAKDYSLYGCLWKTSDNKYTVFATKQ